MNMTCINEAKFITAVEQELPVVLSGLEVDTAFNFNPGESNQVSEPDFEVDWPEADWPELDLKSLLYEMSTEPNQFC